MEHEIGGHAYRFRSEEEVWPVYFVHVLALLRTWWYQANWLIAVPFDIFGEDLSSEFHRVGLSILRQIPVGKAVEPGPFVARLIKETGLTWKGPDDGRPLRTSLAMKVDEK